MTVSLPRWLLDKITALAKADNRNRSNWVVTELQRVVATKEAAGAKLHALPDAAHVDVTPSDSTAGSRVAEDSPTPPSSGPRVRSTRGGIEKVVGQRKRKS
jgi:hypothetical protein